MTTPLIDTVRNIPLVIEKGAYEPMETESISGFPFDRSDRSDNFRNQLDELAQRHPEFAEHLEGFPFRSDSFGRHHRQPRVFPSSRFDHFFEDDPFNYPDHSTAQQPHQETPSSTQTETSGEEVQKPERCRKQNIQPSNTVDLGQKQEPVNDQRSQRSMSAPPADYKQQRYVSSIHIPINKEGGMAEMGKTQSQPEKPKSNERVIPIHVEGRDAPVIPRNTGPPEKIFGQSASQFTQFVPKQQEIPIQRDNQQEIPVQKEQQQHRAATQEIPLQKEQKISTDQQEPSIQQQKESQQELYRSITPIDMIQSIQKDVSELMSQVEKFEGIRENKQYMYLDEMLTRNLIKLDNIDTQGQENIRQARKEAVKCIESCISILEAKAAANANKQNLKEEPTVINQTKIEVEGGEKMEVEGEIKEDQVKVVQDDGKKNENEQVTCELEIKSEMEVAEENNQVVAQESVSQDEEMKEAKNEEQKKLEEEKCENVKDKKKGKKKVAQK